MKFFNEATKVFAMAVAITGMCSISAAGAAPQDYLKLPTPKRILPIAQAWEGDQQPHTLSVIELNKDGYKYWGWFGLNSGRGIGLARSKDLVHWTKYEKNPLWQNARWPSVLKNADPAHPDVLYFAITRDYDTPSSRIVLATSTDGIHLTEVKNLVNPADKERNQNPNLFRDPVSGKFFLTYYRGNDDNYFDIVSKSADRIEDIDSAQEKVLMHTTETVAAPTLVYIPRNGANGKGIYYLATEVYPGRYSATDKGVWQVKVFYSDKPDGKFVPTDDNPVQSDERACLFQHIFNGKFYGYQSHLNHATDKWEMEVLTTPLPK